ncbi:hypothetical protein CS022_02855 [Veronia nyctiphanis]|uniref:N-acetyltransferase domain-containing protein n=1 Tax=Veronia nyctiphanis TaxID=1278244 RepID=A0A4Q0YZG4_9GAMM|nr:GNAT family N-acetyltransferase [Veronia nyctiphanis]RXJ74531.1 hypothetical protein CS022_02855 [Veronia nyctiphanis]
MQIETIHPEQFNDVIRLWETTVRACYEYYSEQHIEDIKQRVVTRQLDNLTLRAVHNLEGEMVGFIGTRNSKIAMLFIHPESQRQGFGRALVRYAVELLHCDHLEVDYRNINAIVFYRRLGFTILKSGDNTPPLVVMQK